MLLPSSGRLQYSLLMALEFGVLCYNGYLRGRIASDFWTKISQPTRARITYGLGPSDLGPGHRIGLGKSVDPELEILL